MPLGDHLEPHELNWVSPIMSADLREHVAIAVIREVALANVLKYSIEQQIQQGATRRLLGHDGTVPTA